MLLNFLIFIYMLMTLSLVAIILAQPGKGFGLESSQSGASKTVFGSSGPRMIQRKVTMVLFGIWIFFTLLLGGIISKGRHSNTFDTLEENEKVETLMFDVDSEFKHNSDSLESDQENDENIIKISEVERKD